MAQNAERANLKKLYLDRFEHRKKLALRQSIATEAKKKHLRSN